MPKNTTNKKIFKSTTLSHRVRKLAKSNLKCLRHAHLGRPQRNDQQRNQPTRHMVQRAPCRQIGLGILPSDEERKRRGKRNRRRKETKKHTPAQSDQKSIKTIFKIPTSSQPGRSQSQRGRKPRNKPKCQRKRQTKRYSKAPLQAIDSESLQNHIQNAYVTLILGDPRGTTNSATSQPGTWCKGRPAVRSARGSAVRCAKKRKRRRKRKTTNKESRQAKGNTETKHGEENIEKHTPGQADQSNTKVTLQSHESPQPGSRWEGNLGTCWNRIQQPMWE